MVCERSELVADSLLTVQTTTGGAFTAVLQPLTNTVYTVKVKNTTSPTLAVTVRPRLRLRKLAPRRYSLRVFAAASFAGKYATFQRYNGALGRWNQRQAPATVRYTLNSAD